MMGKSWITVAALVSVSSVFCRPENDGVFQTDIAGGKPDELYPFFVSMFSVEAQSNVELCGGTIIAPNVVLTAARCVARRNPKRIFVMKYDVGCDENLNIKNYLVHPDYEPDLDDFRANNDVALLYLNGSLDLEQPNYGKLPLCDASEDYPEATAIGLLEGLSLEKHISRALQEVDLPMRHDCKGWKGFFNPEKQVCYGESKGRYGCRGNPGGPLVHKENGKVKCLHGIASYSLSCTWKPPGVYARAGYYKDWIMSNMPN